MGLTFKVMCESDILSVKDIVESFMRFDPEQIKAFLQEKQNVALIAKLDGTTVGLIYGYALTRMEGKAPQFFIYSVDIHSAYQNRGYGGRFVKWAVDWARDNGFCESFVPTEKTNARACRVYEKAGMAHAESDCDRIYVLKY